jgi:predicted RNA-binding protein with PIN domain
MDIIDGYNVLFEIIGHDHPDLEQEKLRKERKDFVSRVQEYADRMNRLTYVAFDGPQDPTPLLGKKKKSDYLTVLFGNNEEEADDVIVELVERESNRGSILVVTEDREVAGNVTDLGASVEDVNTYLQRLDQSLSGEEKKHPGEPPEKYGQKPVEDVDGWLKFFGISGDEDMEELAGQDD